MNPVIAATGLAKTYVLHVQGGVAIPVLAEANLSAEPGDCVVLHGPSGAGKSTLLRCLYGNCKPDQGAILVRHAGAEIDIVTAEPRTIIDIRRRTIGYVSQFLRVIPRVPAIDVVAEPMRAQGQPIEAARARAADLLSRLHIPERLWNVAPATFSGGEQQRVNIARGFAGGHPILLLDEPTASLDADNRRVVISLIAEALERKVAVIGVFHDDEVREAVATRTVTMRAEGNA
jgi:alpha-D-ribose 1-methylphosphonate 5-triphosphate synthase subunit PhnL